MSLRPWVLTSLAFAASATCPRALAAQYRLELLPSGGAIAPVVSAVDVRAAAGEAINPYQQDCIARLRIVGGDGNLVTFRDTDDFRAGVQVFPEGLARRARHPDWMTVGGGGRNLQVLLEPEQAETRYVVELDTVVVVDGGVDVPLPGLQSEPFGIPASELSRCGRSPRTSVDVQQPTEGSDGFALTFDVVQRRPIQGGLWEFFLQGSAAPGDSAAAFDSWKGGAQFDRKLTQGYEHWISLGGVVRLDASQNLATVDRVIGASLKIRLDFLGINKFLSPLVTRFVPYPWIVLEYENVNRVQEDDAIAEGLEPASREVHNRLSGRLDWSAPLVFETTLRVKLHGDLRLGSLPDGVDRLMTLSDVSLEYPLTSAGDVVAILSKLDGESAPLYRSISRYLLGVGIRR